MESFGENKNVAMRALEVISAQLSHLSDEPSSFTLVPELTDEIMNRMLELEDEIFRIEDNVYSKKDVLECLAEEYSLLLVVIISGQIQGFVYGYDEDEETPTVEDTEYFLDSAVMALAYENRGIGTMLSGVILFLLYLLGFKKIGILTEEKDRTGRELVKFYKKIGFIEARTDAAESVGMKIVLDEKFINGICEKLNIKFDASAA